MPRSEERASPTLIGSGAIVDRSSRFPHSGQSVISKRKKSLARISHNAEELAILALAGAVRSRKLPSLIRG
jgi:hypothetical protein